MTMRKRSRPRPRIPAFQKMAATKDVKVLIDLDKLKKIEMSGNSDAKEELKLKYLDALSQGSAHEEFKEVNEVKSIISKLKDAVQEQTSRELSYERFLFIIDQYQEQPHLLDPHLDAILNQMLAIVRNPDTPDELLHETFKYMYIITKTRGFKVIVRMMPHEVADLEPVLELLAKQDVNNFGAWETRYMLLLWLSIVSMIPFDMVRLDSNAKSESGEVVREPIMDRIFNAGKMYLFAFDKSRDAAAYLVAKFLTRPDVKKMKMASFMDWAKEKIDGEKCKTMAGASEVAGSMSTLAYLFKHAKREDLMDYAPVILEKINTANVKDCGNSYLRKFAIKIVQRLGLTLMKYRLASWRYQRGSRSLSDNLKKDGPVISKLEHKPVADDDEDYDIPDEIEEIIEQLLAGLKDKDTVVRWSAAKGVGRVTGRLPKELADEVVGSVLELFTLQETDGAWHGGALALAELGRRGLLLPQRLNDVVPVVLKALAYDEKRGNFSVGAHVRDAACYVCWAFARAYEPDDLAPYVNSIASALIIVSVFDREVNVRRAAAAAFQENVGRQGQFPHGIDILTTCDYYAVGIRTNCYLELSVYVAQFEEYTHALIDHLVKVTSNHWDVVLRELTAKALHNLTIKDPEYMAKTALPTLIPKATGWDLAYRHGAILAIAEITHALSILAQEKQKKVNTTYLNEQLDDDMRQIAKKLFDAQLFKGLSGELTRKAVCCLIQKLSNSKMPYHGDPVIGVWQDLIDDCLCHAEPDVQLAAIAAVDSFSTEYYRQQDGSAVPLVQEKLIDKYLGQLRSSSQEQTRQGHALALGAFPKFLLSGRLKSVIAGLIVASNITDKEKQWAEARRDAIKALTSLCLTVGVDKNGSPNEVVCKENMGDIYEALLVALQDYTLDSRGDVGAWVREAAMTGLWKITSLVVTTDASMLTEDMSSNMFSSVIQQACEKIDRTRAHAGEVFISLLYHSPSVPNVPCREELEKYFPREDVAFINWSAPSDTFPQFQQLLSQPAYMYRTLLGLTVSVGGLTESLVKHSSQSLFSYMRSIQDNQEAMNKFTETLLKIMQDYRKVDRVTIPMFKMIDQLLANNCFDMYGERESDEFPLKLLTQCKEEIARSCDPQKIMSSADVFCGLLQFAGQTRQKASIQLMIFLCHKYPRVRKTTANKLYEAVVTFDDIIADEHLDEVMTILSDTLWDNPVEELRPIRNQLCDLIGVPKPTITKAKR
ncbi:tubulin-specific chaperone D-like isoform X2 [Lineus longissimus]|uniref:tubulin-specific chaperone D-like isoform X2 n=1 Tax=Lineus longissimus TaxID=88925 RepID=UPI002B4D3250